MPKNTLKTTYIIPVKKRLTKHKQAELEKLHSKYGKMVQWFLTIFFKEGLDFRDMALGHARKIVKDLCYPTDSRPSKYNCKGAIGFPHSHYYDTAIVESIQKWESFLAWKDKRQRADKPIKKNFPQINKYSPVFDQTMFRLDLEKGWITINGTSIKNCLNIPITVPNKARYEDIEHAKISSIKLCKNKSEEFVFHLCVSQSLDVKIGKSTQSDKEPVGVYTIGIDLGERHLVAESSVKLTPDGKLDEKVIQTVRYHDDNRGKQSAYTEHHIRRKMQKKGKSRLIPARRWRTEDVRSESVKDIVRSISENVRSVKKDGYEVYVFIGDLHAPVPKGRGALSRRLNSYPRGNLRDRLMHRLKGLGAKGGTPSEWKTSKLCHVCGSENTNRKTQGLFICNECGLVYNADANASWNILGRGVRRRSSTPKILNKWVESTLGAIP